MRPEKSERPGIPDLRTLPQMFFLLLMILQQETHGYEEEEDMIKEP